jgi:hypothetical protein
MRFMVFLQDVYVGGWGAVARERESVRQMMPAAQVEDAAGAASFPRCSAVHNPRLRRWTSRALSMKPANSRPKTTATAGAPFAADKTATSSEARPAQMEKAMLAMA